MAVRHFHAKGQTAFPAKRRAILLVWVFACLACESRAMVDGKLIAPSGGQETGCKVELHYEAGDPGTGLQCHASGAPGQGAEASVVKVGQGFECDAVTISGAVDVTAACDGYEPYRSPAFRWSGSGFRPAVHHFGDIVLKRASETESK